MSSQITFHDAITNISQLVGIVELYLDDKLIWSDDNSYTYQDYLDAIEPYMNEEVKVKSIHIDIVHFHHCIVKLYSERD